jgi:hypothetical protein
VAVALSSAGVKDADNEAFAGDYWQYSLEQPVPPQVQSISPAAGSELGQLAGIDLVFDRAVLGVAAAALAVNGTPATAITGGGVGPYHFSGWLTVGPGTTNVVLTGGAIHDTANLSLPDKSWTYQIRDCNGNGIPDGLDVADDPNADCNENGIPDDCETGALSISIGQITSLKLGQQVTLGGQPTAAGGLPPYSYSWTLPGNTFGASFTGANPQYSVSLPGTYHITLTVSDSASCTKTASLTITVATDAPSGSSLSGCGAGCGPGGGALGLMTAMWIATLGARRRRNRR